MTSACTALGDPAWCRLARQYNCMGLGLFRNGTHKSAFPIAK